MTGRLMGILLFLMVIAALSRILTMDEPRGAQQFGRLEGGGVRIDHALGQPVMIPQIEKQQAAMVTNAVHPAAEARVCAHIARTERATSVRTIAVHGQTLR